MAFIPISNTAMVELFYTWDNQRCENTFYVEDGAGYTPVKLTTLAILFRDWWGANMDTLTSAQLSLVGIKATDLTTVSSASIETSSGMPLPGLVAGGSVPNNVAGCITLQTALRGRSYRGRNYIPGIPATKVNNNEIDSTHVSNYVAAYLDLATDITAAGQTLVVASRYTNNAPRAAGVVTPVTGFKMDDIVDSMRRRLPGRGI